MKFSLILGCLASVALHAQDTRTVTKPAFPARLRHPRRPAHPLRRLARRGRRTEARHRAHSGRARQTRDVTYDDICIRDSPKPITLDTGYTAAGTPTGNKPPTMRDITLTNVHLRRRQNQLQRPRPHARHRRYAVKRAHRGPKSPPKPYTYSLHHADVTLGSARPTSPSPPPRLCLRTLPS